MPRGRVAGWNVVGFDAYKHGWVGVCLADGGFAGASLHPDFASVLASYPRCASVSL